MTSERLYRILLKAYPRGYRRAYEEDMAQCFRDQFRAANTVGRRIGLWLSTVADFALSLPARHLERWVRRLRVGVPDGWTQRAVFAIYFARFAASSFSCGEIGLEHLLLGILREDPEFAATLLGPIGVKEIVKAIETQAVNPRRRPSRTQCAAIPLGDECKMALAQVMDEIDNSDQKVSPRHLLAVIVHRKTSLAARLLQERGVDLSRL